MADQVQYKRSTDEMNVKYPVNEQHPYTGQPPPYNMAPTYSQDTGAYASSSPVVVTTQPTPTHNVVMVDNAAPYQERHHATSALAIGTLICAICTLVVTFPFSAFCTVPAIILSSLALARDRRVEEAKAYSMASLVLIAVFYILVIISIIVVVIIVVVLANQVKAEVQNSWDHKYYG